MNKDIIKKIKSLMAKTTENGCTESEALLAAEKAAKLMQRYNLSLSQVEIESEKYDADGRRFATGKVKRHFHGVVHCASNVAKLCGCKGYMSGFDMVFFGSETNTQIAHYLIDLLRNAMDLEYKAARKKDKSLHKNSFMVGMATRLNQRIMQMIAEKERGASAQSNGQEIVTTQNAILNREFARSGVRIKGMSAGPNNRDGKSFEGGRAAADNVNISSGVNSRHPRALLA